MLRPNSSCSLWIPVEYFVYGCNFVFLLFGVLLLQDVETLVLGLGGLVGTRVPVVFLFLFDCL